MSTSAGSNDKKNEESKSAGGILGKQFQKMRRRLTVTGSSQNIDGVVKPGIAPSGDLKKYKGSKSDQVSASVISATVIL